MNFKPIEKLNFRITELPDRVTGRGEYIKGYFDGNALQLMAAYNALVDELNKAGSAGSLGGVLYGNESVKHIRLGLDEQIEVSADGVNWTSASGGGHVIYDKDGTAQVQRARLKFEGAEVTDDGTYTVVTPFKGDKGEKGDKGDKGDIGEKGMPGKVYVPSVDDDGQLTWQLKDDISTIVGAVNLKGIQGAMGLQGAKGDQGLQGEKGVQGQSGQDGADGVVLTIKAVFETESELRETVTNPIDGDGYCVGTEGDYEVYIFDTIKNDFVSLGAFGIMRGPRGYTGPQGPQGVQGPQGIQGLQGPRGLQGAMGVPGSQGLPTVVNGKTGQQIVLTCEDIGAAAQSHGHGLSDIAGLSDELSKKANISKVMDVQLSASAWNNGSITVSNNNIDEASIIHISPSKDITQEAFRAYQRAQPVCTDQKNGSITLRAFGQTPSVDIRITMSIGG